MDKKCCRCQLNKSIMDFYTDKRNKDGKYNHCKECHKISCHGWESNNKNYKKDINKKWTENNKERIHQRYEANKEKISLRNKIYYASNKEIVSIKNKKYRETHRKERNTHEQHRLKTDRVYRVITNLRKALCDVVRRKTKRTLDLIGCTGEFYVRNIEKKFTNEMNWDNIHIDHIIPLDYFDLENPEELEKACHWTNTQPLFSEVNIGKSNILPADFHRRIWKGKDIGWIIRN